MKREQDRRWTRSDRQKVSSLQTQNAHMKFREQNPDFAAKPKQKKEQVK